MILLRKPSVEFVHRFIDQQRQLELTYSAIGATANEPPQDYVVDRTRVELGRGEQVFLDARNALENWEQFRLGWLEASPSTTTIAIGETVAVIARLFGAWWLNACRIVYVIDHSGPTTKFGFAYGTLPDHAASGEERFLIEWNHADGSVWYDILAFSRPRHFLVRLAYPLTRRIQKRFARDSSAAMIRASRLSITNR